MPATWPTPATAIPTPLRAPNAPRVRSRAALALGLCLGCGSGGGGSSGPDTTPPPAPNSARIEVGIPIPSGSSQIDGGVGAVEGSATATVVNVDATERAGGTTVQAQTVAGSDGSFTVTIPALLGDQLRITATDDAGNESVATSLRAGPVTSDFAGEVPGDFELFTFVEGIGAISLPFPAGDERFLVVVQSLNPSGDEFTVEVTGSIGLDTRSRAVASATRASGAWPGPEASIRESERRLLPLLGRPGAAGAGRRELATAQELGSTRQFFVANGSEPFDLPDLLDPDRFDDVTAELRFIGDNSLVYVDLRTPEANLTDPMAESIGQRFDEEVFPTDVTAFGLPSDIDDNQKVILLLTPTINEKNTQDTVDDGVVFLGFFFGIDLFVNDPLAPFSNEADMMYGVIPDPNMEFSPARFPIEVADELVLSTFAHELEHLISANQHFIVRQGNPEDVWLDEGLAHMAESLNGFALQNRLRSALFLDEPQETSLTGGDDTLERRGAAWLFVQYLADRFGQGILRSLVQTSRTGIDNVDSAANRSFPFLFHEWASTLFLDDLDVSSDPFFDLPSIDLRSEFELARQDLDPGELGTYLDLLSRILPGPVGDGAVTTRTVSGPAAAFFEVRTSAQGTLPLVVESTRQSNLQVTVFRTE